MFYPKSHCEVCFIFIHMLKIFSVGIMTSKLLLWFLANASKNLLVEVWLAYCYIPESMLCPSQISKVFFVMDHHSLVTIKSFQGEVSQQFCVVVIAWRKMDFSLCFTLMNLLKILSWSDGFSRGFVSDGKTFDLLRIKIKFLLQALEFLCSAFAIILTSQKEHDDTTKLWTQD